MVTLQEKIKRALRLADMVGRSRQSNNFAANGAAVRELVDLELEIDAALNPEAELADLRQRAIKLGYVLVNARQSDSHAIRS